MVPFLLKYIPFGEGNGNQLQCSLLENPRNGGAWWAAVYGVAQSRTRLKRLSSSSSNILCWIFSSYPCYNLLVVEFYFKNEAQLVISEKLSPIFLLLE